MLCCRASHFSERGSAVAALKSNGTDLGTGGVREAKYLSHEPNGRDWFPPRQACLAPF
jgi:hypothetical protein